MIRYFAVFFVISFSAQRCYSQLQLTVGEGFLTGMNVIKVKVTPEDHTVWALLSDGKVYYKKETDADFQVYPLTAGLVVSHLTGFNLNEMYFHVAPDKLIQIKNGVSIIIPVVFPGVTRINDIAAVNQHKDTPYYTFFPTVFNDDWIAIATNKHMYRLIRGTSAVKEQYPYANAPFYSEPNWEITNDAFKSVDFRYRHPVGGRCFDTDYIYHNSVGSTIYESLIPERSPYPSKTNCTLFGFHWNQPFRMFSSHKFLYNFWGTDDGLYLKDFACNNQFARKVITGQVINDIEEIYALTPVYKQNYVLAATNTGIWYTRASIFPEYESGPNINKTVFTSFASFPAGRVNSICADTKEYETIDVGTGDTYTSVCEKVIWAGTHNGVRKIYVGLDQTKFDTFVFTSFGASKPVNNFNNPTFDLCEGEAVNINLLLSATFQNQLVIQWYKDGVEDPAMAGKMSVELSKGGTYKAKLTSLCEGISIWSTPFTIQNSLGPEITFNYPPEMSMCEGSNLTLTTINKPGYQYRWYKDNQIIPSATSSTLTLNKAGEYRVEVSNCSNVFQPSSPVKVNTLSLPTPVIQSSKNIYCNEETAELRITSSPGQKIRWFINGSELPKYANANSIIVNTTGSYTAMAENTDGCQQSSAAFNLQFVPPPDVRISKSKALPLCYNESVTISTNQSTGKFLWSTGETTPTIVVNKAGSYSVQVTNATGCSKSADIAIEMLPPISLGESKEERICTISSEKITLRAESGYKFYIWNGNKSQKDALVVTSPGVYLLQVEDENGCTAEIVFTVKAWCKEVIIPNTFTPNNDGKNDFWIIGGLEEDNSVRLVIYNRDGRMVYEKNGCCINWDGQLNGAPLPAGAYYYILTAAGGKLPFKGTVTILR